MDRKSIPSLARKVTPNCPSCRPTSKPECHAAIPSLATNRVRSDRATASLRKFWKSAPAIVLTSVLWAVLLTGCASTPSPGEEALSESEQINDPFEGLNRGIFAFNQFADALIIKPLALLYRLLLPPEVRRGVHNTLENLHAPVTLANDLMQGEGGRAGNTIGRFLINSTVGIGGLMDVAADFGIEGHREDFGQTLSVWGSGGGPYIIIPILGPSNLRDVTGLVADAFLDPLNYYAPDDALLARTLVRGIDERERVLDTLDEIERTSLDFYATLRSLYRQHRNNQIRNGEPAPAVPIPALSFGDFDGGDDVKEDTVSLADRT